MKKRLFKMKEIVESLPNDWVMPDSLKLILTFERDNPADGTTTTETVDVFESTDWIDFFASYYDFGFNWLDTGKSAFDTFVDMYTCWVNNVKPMLNRAVTAAYVKYDPISNYDRKEHAEDNRNAWRNNSEFKRNASVSESDADSGASTENGKNLSITWGRESRDMQGNIISKLTYDDIAADGSRVQAGGQEVTQTISGGDSGYSQDVISAIGSGSGDPVTVTRHTRPFDGSDPKEDDKTENKGSVYSRSASKARGYSKGNESSTLAEQETDKGENNLHAYGNIGVTTNAQMVTEELKLRFNVNFAKLCHEMFVRDNLYYGGWD